VIDWTDILYGGALSAVLAGVVTAVVANERRGLLGLLAGVAALVGPFLWNSILRATHANEFFTDAPMKAFPVSWQDTGSGVFALALAALIFGFGPLAFDPARRALAFAVVTGLSALVVDVYLY
jgi:hypothetical protein